MNRERNVILFGAGAAIGWDGPTTKELTEIILTRGYKTTSGDMHITELIYRQLREQRYSDKELNFETIINVIEELIFFYAYFDWRNRTPSILQSFFTPRLQDEILNFSIEGGEQKHGYKLEIPKGRRCEYAKRSFNNETPEQFFLQQLLAEILTCIVQRVEKYAVHTKNRSNIISPQNAPMNTLFASWIKKVVGESILRMYTLNYDRNFRIILETDERPLSIFEGYDCGHILDYDHNVAANVPRILNDFECNTHYNLHGSAFWRVQAKDENQLSNPSFNLTTVAHFPINDFEQANYQTERGRTLMLTNIVTGFQKTQRAIFSPIRQMQAAFDRDCVLAKRLYIIGYSFSDEHINASIRVALKYNKDVKIIIVNPDFSKDDLDLNVVMKIFTAVGYLGFMRPTGGSKEHDFFEGKIKVHENKFSEYMQSYLG